MTKKFYFSAQAVLLFVCFLAGGSSLWAQSDPGTSDDGFLVKITSPASIVQTLANDVQNCGWVGSSFGPSVTSNFCGDVVWALPDSVGCNPFPAGSLTGKIAMTRRGGCNFSLKVYHAQQAGAIAVIVTNHYTGLYDGPCLAKNADGSLFFGGMAAGDSAAAVTIPSIFIQRFTSEQIDGALKNGETVNVCFSLPKATDAAAAYHYATPVSQVDTLDHLGMRMTNRESSTLFNIGLKAVVETPGGSTTTLTATVDSVAPNANVYTYFPAYLPPAVLGKFKVTYTNDFYTAPEDTLVRYFEHTPYTFATDNLVIDPGGVANDASFADADFFVQSGALCLTNEAGGIATHATFGLANADAIYIDNPLGAENDINVYLYDMDADDDGTWDVSNDGTGTFDDLASGFVGYAVYQVNGQEGVDSLISVALDDFNNPGTFEIALKPNHPYFISLSYDGVEAGTGIMPRFSNTLDEFYLNFPSTMLHLGDYFSGWGGAIVIQRLQLKGFDPSVKTKTVPNLNVDVQLTPNPASDILRVNLDFGQMTSKATVSLMNGLGRVMNSQLLNNFQSGQLTFQVNDLPSGTYLLSIRTADGVAIRKVSVVR
ncbi:MAG: T9SS type A sorting domain-containing protein [Saprospirales bacterium]|nr:T9SS type A sorting domain-containing protein [Saprospirales bacterium]